MNDLFKDLTIRPPTVEDGHITIDLMIARDIADYGEADSILEDLLHDWTQINLEQDAWLVFNSDDNLVGYAAVYKDNTDIMFDFYAHPTLGSETLTNDLVAQCEARSRALLAESQEAQSRTAKTIISQVNQVGVELLKEMGFEPKKFYFRMKIELDSLPTSPEWPEDCTIRTIVPKEDDEMVYDFIQTAFAQPGRTPPPFDQWRDFMMRPDHFENDLWFLLFHKEELIGAALCFDYEGYGWVRQLGVAPSWRRQGLGANLLQYVFRVFFQKGHKRVELVVDSSRPTAQSVYENVGMKCVQQYNEYHKVLSR